MNEAFPVDQCLLSGLRAGLEPAAHQRHIVALRRKA
jgi:hypothetical protein